jgi:hypothetical protein
LTTPGRSGLVDPVQLARPGHAGALAERDCANVYPDRPDIGRRRAQWMVAAQDGDRVAYAALLDDIGPMLQQLIAERIGDGRQGAQTYRDVLGALHRARHTYDARQPFEGWLSAIMMTIIRRHEDVQNQD